MRALVALLLFLLTAPALANFRAHASLEESYEPLGSLVRTSMRAKVEREIGSGFSPYLLAGSEGAGPERYPLRLNSDAYLFAAPGMRFNFGNFTITAEARFRKYYMLDPGAESPSLVDVQSLLVYEDYWDRSLAESAGLNLFAAFYSETNFTSADSGNLIHTTLLRAGPELRLMQGAYFSLYVEPNFVVDRVHHYYNNRAELRLGSRLRYNEGPWDLNLTVCYLFNQYFKMKYAEDYPPPDRNQGITAKLTLAVHY